MYKKLDSHMSVYIKLLTGQLDGEQASQLAWDWAREQLSQTSRQTIKWHKVLSAAYSLNVLLLISPPDYEMEN